MPGINGLELGSALRKSNPDAIIIYVSSYPEYFTDAYRNVRADYYMLKPYKHEDVEDALERARLLAKRQKKKNNDGQKTYEQRIDQLLDEMQNVRLTKLSQPLLEEYHRQIRNLAYFAVKLDNQFAIMKIRDLLMEELVRLDLAFMRPEEQELITSKFLEFLIDKKPYEICKRTLRSLSKSYADTGIRGQIIGMVPTRPEMEFPQALEGLVRSLDTLRARLRAAGYTLMGDEPCKLTLLTKPYGYTGEALATLLRNGGVECEYADPDQLVLMPSVRTSCEELCSLGDLLCSIERRTPIAGTPPLPRLHDAPLTPRQAMLAPAEEKPTEECLGRILASPSVSCPPAVPIAICGEVLTQEDLGAFAYYGIRSVRVLRE